MRVPFVICDVFTDRRFGGNPLAVITDARDLSDADMQAIAREFGFSETTFVLPAAPDDPDAATHRVRIFTPVAELPFAGHPNIGTAFVLASAPGGEATEMFRFREGAGLVEVRVMRGASGIACELRAPEPFRRGGDVDVVSVAEACGIDAADISTRYHAPCFASVGLPFIVAELIDRAALVRARADIAAFGRLPRVREHAALLVYVRDGEAALDCRMFVDHGGTMVEDPATGSANGALAALLASLGEVRDGDLRLHSRQGDDMGRPSRLALRVTMRGGEVGDVYVGGRSVQVAEGRLLLDG